MSEPKILFCDIETSPLEVYAWGIGEQTIALNQIIKDWSILSWAAKWRGDKKLFYEDVRSQRDIRSDKKILKGLWDLLNEADIVVWHYGKHFDHGKINARLKLNGFQPPSPYRQIDTKEISSRNFKFTSNKLEYLAGVVNKNHQKSKHKKFPGMELWTECMKGNLEAFKEMEHYNKHDILALEELHAELQPWQQRPINFNVYNHERITNACNCGSANFKRSGWAFTASGKFQRYRCNDCGAYWQDSGAANNALSKEKRSGLKRVQT